jgi:hypothetical protein
LESNCGSFPKIVVKTIAYTSPMESVFESIRKMQLRFRRPKKDSGQLAFPGFDIEGRADGTSVSVFHRLILMQRAESSPAALTSTIDAMLAREYEESFEPVDPERSEANCLNFETVCDARTDTKLYALVDLLKQRPPEDRVLLFSSHVATVEYLLIELKKQLTHRRIGDRSGLYSAMARTNVVGEHERDLGRYEDRDVGFVRALYEEQDYESNLSEYIPTSQHLVDRAKATPAEVNAARALPLGSRSARKASPRGTFALLRSSDLLHCVFREGDLQISSPDEVAHEALAPRAAAERGTAALPLPSTSDRILSQIVEDGHSRTVATLTM